MKKVNQEKGSAVRNFEMGDYNKNIEISKGLAATHEQVSDYYMSGEAVPSKYETTLPRSTSKKSE